eukprot:jgi/Tetstr1/435057/TSEL_024027.t1
MGRRYPSLFSYGLFSHDGPTEEMMAQTRFSMTFVARGFKSGAPVQASDKPDMQIVTRVEGPEPGYVATPIFLSAAGLTLLEEESALRSSPGVHTVATLFNGTSYLDKLQQHGISFSVDAGVDVDMAADEGVAAKVSISDVVGRLLPELLALCEVTFR